MPLGIDLLDHPTTSVSSTKPCLGGSKFKKYMPDTPKRLPTVFAWDNFLGQRYLFQNIASFSTGPVGYPAVEFQGLAALRLNLNSGKLAEFFHAENPNETLDVDSPMSLFLHTTDDGWNPGSEGFCQQQFYHPIEMLMNLFCHEAALWATPSGCLLSVVIYIISIRTLIIWYMYISMYITSYNQLLVVFLYMRISYLIKKSWTQNLDIYLHIAIFNRSSKRFPNRCLVRGACRCLAWTAEATWLCCGPWCGRDVFTGDLRHGSLEESWEPGWKILVATGGEYSQRFPLNDNLHISKKGHYGFSYTWSPDHITKHYLWYILAFVSVPDSITNNISYSIDHLDSMFCF